jgi:hypothetical protein
MERACSRDALIPWSLMLIFANIENTSPDVAEHADELVPKIVEASHGINGPAAGSLTVWR